MKKHYWPQFERIRRILELIREGTRTGALANGTDFSRECGVSWRTAMRDLELLRERERAPIEYDASRKGYYLNDATWSLRPVHLSRSEVFAFTIARKLAAAYRGTPLELDIQSALEKIGESLRGAVSVDLGAVTDRLSILREDYVVQDPEIWGEVARRTERSEAIDIRYRRFDGELRRYTIEPYHLFFYHGNWYVVGRGERRDEPATFAISRILEVDATGRHFVVPETFDAKAHAAEAFGIVGGDKPIRVRLVFSKKVATYIRERVWHPSQQMKDRRDGSLELRFETTGWKELVRWVLSWQPDVVVVSPKRLRERVKEKMTEALNR